MLCWGSAYVPSAWMMRDLEPLAAAGVRLGIGGLALVGFLAATGRPVSPGVPWGVVAWLGLTQTALFYGGTYWGIRHESAGLAAVLANTDPLFVAVLSAVVLHQDLTPRQWAGIALGFAGAVLAASPDLAAPRFSVAAAVVLVGAAAWGVGTITAARHMRRTGSALGLAGWQMILGAAMLLAAAAARGHAPGPVGTRTALVSLVTGLVGSALPLALFYEALRTGPAAELSALFFLVPVVGVLTAWPLLGETPSSGLAVGLVAVSVGLVMVLAPSRRGRYDRPDADGDPRPG